MHHSKRNEQVSVSKTVQQDRTNREKWAARRHQENLPARARNKIQLVCGGGRDQRVENLEGTVEGIEGRIEEGRGKKGIQKCRTGRFE